MTGVDNIIEMLDIEKEFPGVKALTGVSFAVKTGEIHALIGENGAGKSTLMKVLSGVHPYPTYSGNLTVKGKEARFSGAREAEEAGISIIHQELNLIPELNVGQNIFLGREPRFRFGFINAKKLRADSKALLERLGIELPLTVSIKELSIGKQQMVEIARALSCEADVLVLDEPTSALTEVEVEALFRIMGDLKAKGVAMIYISHKLNEVLEVADRITVLRDGTSVGTMDRKEVTIDKIISMMVGRNLSEMYPKKTPCIGDPILSVKNLSIENLNSPGRWLVRGISFDGRKGETLGIFGLMGAGRTELASALFGAAPGPVTGDIVIKGEKARLGSPHEAIKKGVSFVSEDRKRYGLVLIHSVGVNITLACLRHFVKLGFVQRGPENGVIQKFIESLKIKVSEPGVEARTLSGGNQQKVVVSKCLATSPDILILDEPTRGVDVGAKVEIYQIINDLTAKGVLVLMVSSELPEILGMCDRILVMHEGRMTGEFSREEANQERIMKCATGMQNATGVTA